MTLQEQSPNPWIYHLEKIQKIYPDCEIIQHDYDTDEFGHPLGGSKLGDVQQRLVFLEYYRIKDKGDKELSRIRREWAAHVHPAMLCGNPRCINPRHMVWARYHPKDRMEDGRRLSNWEYGNFSERFHSMAVRFRERYEKPIERQGTSSAMAKVTDVDTELDDLSDEELLEIIHGQRKLRIQEPKTNNRTSKKRKKKRKTPKELMEEQMKEIASLPLEERKKIFRQLGGNLED